MGDVVQFLSKASKAPSCGTGSCASEAGSDEAVLLVREEAGDARVVIRQRLPKHVARQILRLMAESAPPHANRSSPRDRE